MAMIRHGAWTCISGVSSDESRELSPETGRASRERRQARTNVERRGTTGGSRGIGAAAASTHHKIQYESEASSHVGEVSDQNAMQHYAGRGYMRAHCTPAAQATVK